MPRSIEETKYDRLPEHMQHVAKEYVETGIVYAGSFMWYVLTNNLVDSYGQADEINQARMFDWAMWLYNDAPRGCWRTESNIKEWAEARRKEREELETAT